MCVVPIAASKKRVQKNDRQLAMCEPYGIFILVIGRFYGMSTLVGLFNTESIFLKQLYSFK